MLKKLGLKQTVIRLLLYFSMAVLRIKHGAGGPPLHSIPSPLLIELGSYCVFLAGLSHVLSCFSLDSPGTECVPLSSLVLQYSLSNLLVS